jgi:cytochrome c6
MKKKTIISVVTAFAVAALAAPALAGNSPKGKTGKELFKDHCAVCHPEGGNIVNAKKTLLKADREANGIKKAADVVKLMRDPGPGMSKFDKEAIPDKDARKIAEYVLKTFK